MVQQANAINSIQPEFQSQDPKGGRELIPSSRSLTFERMLWLLPVHTVRMCKCNLSSIHEQMFAEGLEKWFSG